MDEGTRLFSWLLRDTLERHYAGNKTLMAKDLGIDRHTLWRTFRAGEEGKGHISAVVAQQFLWCCMRHGISLDDSFLEYLEQRSQKNTQQCKQVRKWIQGVETGNRGLDSGLMMEIVQQVVPELMVILKCNQMSDRLNSPVPPCKFKHACPILKLMGIAQAQSGRLHGTDLLLDR